MNASYVLVAEDDDFVADAVCAILKYLGYGTLRAPGGREAWALFQQRGARAVITDNSLGLDRPSRMSGLALARLVKRHSPRTPVVMLSAIPAEEARRVCDTVLTKPVPATVLAEALARLGVHPCPG